MNSPVLKLKGKVLSLRKLLPSPVAKACVVPGNTILRGFSEYFSFLSTFVSLNLTEHGVFFNMYYMAGGIAVSVVVTLYVFSFSPPPPLSVSSSLP